MDTFCQSPVTTNTKGENENVVLTSEGLNNSDTLAEMLKDLTINDAKYYNSDENEAEVHPKIDQKVATQTSEGNKRKVTGTTNENSPHNLLSNPTLPIITTGIDPQIPDGVATCGGNPHAHLTPTSKVVITDAAHSSAHVLRTPGEIFRRGRDSTTSHDYNNFISPPRLNSPVLIDGGTTIFQTRTGSQDIVIPKGPTGSVEVKNTQRFNTSNNGNLDKNRDSTPIFNKKTG